MKSLIFIIPAACFAYDCSIELDVCSPCLVECTGKHSMTYDGSNHKYESRFSKKDYITESHLGLTWGHDPQSHVSITLKPENGARLLLNGIEYPGSFSFHFGKKVLNHVDVDFVVQSILESPEFLGYNIETLKALAIALRTDLVAEKKIFSAEELNYEGSSMLFQYPKIAQAVVETKKEIITYHEHAFPTSYCKDAAGKNAAFSDIFRQNCETPQGQQLPIQESKKWQKLISREEFCQKLKIEELKNLAFYKDQKTTKIYAVKIEDKSGKRVIMIDRFMSLLDLASNQFQFESRKNEFVFEGQGEGLGVGLCLKTAEFLAKNGHTYKQIIETCYPGTQLSLLDK